MILATYPDRFVTWIGTLGAILLLSCFVCVYCSEQPITLYEKNPLVTLFAPTIRDKAVEIANRIPGTLIKFLEERKIIKKIHFKDDISVIEQTIANEKHKNLDEFQKNLRESIKNAFKKQLITEIRPEDLAEDIRQHYTKELKEWAKPGQRLLTIVRFDKFYDIKMLETWTKVHAYVYTEIYQICDNNWIVTNEYKFTYNLSIEINGLSIDSKKAKYLEELLVKNDVSTAIKQIEDKTKAVSWDDL